MTSSAPLIAAALSLSTVFAALMVLGLIVTAALTIYAAANIIAPFFQSREEQLRFEVLDEDLRSIEELVAQRSYLMMSLRELHLDHETGKISDEDYESTRRTLELEAVKVLSKIDDVHGGRGWQESIDEELAERLDGIRRRRADAPAAAQAPETQAPSDEPDETDEPAAQVECPDCGKDMEPDARFCSQCGYAFDDGYDELAEESADDAEDAESASDTSAPVDELVNEQSSDMNDTSAEVVR
jgi:hypothetical protein